MIEFHFNKADGIVYGKSTGEITFEQMADTQKKVMAIKGLPKIIRILEDASEAEVKISMHELKLIRDLIETGNNDYEFIKHAVVIKSPIAAAYGMWFEENSIHINYKLKMFHSAAEAKRWLMLGK